ncbi:3-hydroxyacyl-[acyl-carrier-protein] dehydratase FabZ [Chitiniphilus shinanonensis]|uniref:3-hydroxyacyl-[acyl-carrier-protein] dehydratase FabZ n=1 Tax=Chitiniphilus shinanonensis TaxID=553088 RepID=A0ABQ6BWI5_9NEIS|nr:3-hydroxyacyl-ACP dehydratase FabZ [Chitiniphilus shinanonensis]GLS06330.1 3-hydroxyacyl-[acyl-carrier-protein] dehydratase FabZ [Chitiniphilus shinanonensis]
MSPTTLLDRDPLTLPVAEVIPHREPFLLLDSVSAGVPGEWVTAHYRVREDNPVFRGHFPDEPVFPGVLLLENMAQAACWVMAAAEPGQGGLYVLVRVTQSTFHQMVRPGDQLETRARLSRRLERFSQFDCEVSVGGHRVASAELLVSRRDKAVSAPAPQPAVWREAQ